MTSFYVSKIGGGKPTFRHNSFDEAVREAQRLIDNLGGEYEILEVRAVVKAAPKYIVQEFKNTTMSGHVFSSATYNPNDDLQSPF